MVKVNRHLRNTVVTSCNKLLNSKGTDDVDISQIENPDFYQIKNPDISQIENRDMSQI